MPMGNVYTVAHVSGEITFPCIHVKEARLGIGNNTFNINRLIYCGLHGMAGANPSLDMPFFGK